MIEINLIPDVKREYLKTRMLRNAVISMSIMVGAAMVGVTVVLGLIVGGQALASAIHDNTIKNEGNKLMAIDGLDQMVTIQNQLSSIDGQHTSRTIDSRLFDVMTAINPPAPNDVRISVLKLDPAERTIFIEGSAVNGYVALEVFKKTIANTMVHIQQEGEEASDEAGIPLSSEMRAGDNSFGEDAEGRKVLRFSFTFTYPDELFARSEHPVAIVTPQGRVDVTDSRLGVPMGLFSPRAEDIDEEGN